ncbi:KH domain-containing protein [Candidatus Gottesmanbacteria bacterium]|nr:KH domain-containing protein [Candidatus Gottesmanbacteria bacterium]
MKQILEYIISLIIQKPEDLKVTETQIDDLNIQYIITANKDDVGKIIGKQGKIIQAIRNIAIIWAIKNNKQIRIDVG